MTTLLPRPCVGVPSDWRFPVPRKFRLDNGMAVQAFDMPGQLVVSATLLLDVPLSLEPFTQEGVATFALRGADEGTQHHPGSALVDAIESQGATMSGSARLWGTQLDLDAPTTRLAPALELLTEVAATPVYAEQDVIRHVALRLTEIDQTMASPASCASLGLLAAVSSTQSRMHRPTAGRAETVAGLTADDVRAFHDRWWTPCGATLVVAGQLPDDLERMLQDTLGAWAPPINAHEPQPPTMDAEPAPDVVWLIDRPEAVQATIAIGALTPTRSDDSWSSAQVGITALGGTFGSRLNTVLREERGFTYGASCSLRPSRDRGLFSMRTDCRVEVAAEATTTALHLLDVASAPFTDAELDAAISYLVGGAPLTYDTADAIVSQASALALAGLPSSWLDQHHARVRATDAESATAALTPWIDRQRLHTVIVGPADQLADPLRAAGLTPRICTTPLDPSTH